MNEETRNTLNEAPNASEGSGRQPKPVLAWLIIVAVLLAEIASLMHLLGVYNKASDELQPIPNGADCSCESVRQWPGFEGTLEGRIGQFEDTQHLNFPVVNGEPQLEANLYPVSSPASKLEFLKGKQTGVVGLLTFIKNNEAVLREMGFNWDVVLDDFDYKSYIVEHEDHYDLNEKGCALATEFARIINSDLVEVKLIWIDADLAEKLYNANNNGGTVTYSRLVYSASSGMTAWEVTFYKADADGNKTTEVVKVERQLTRCGNLTPEYPVDPPNQPDEPGEPETPKKNPPEVKPEGDDNFAGKPDNPGNPPADPGVTEPPQVPTKVDPEVKPDDPYIPPANSGEDDYVPPNPNINPPAPSPTPDPDVTIPPEDDRSGDPGGF